MKKLIVASNNKGKLKEIKEILSGIYEVVPMGEAGFNEDIVEDGNSFYENALIKAKTVSSALNADALADDSGLCVEALNGEPGIYSARYSGSHGDDAANRAKLLKELEGKENRKAKFVSAVVLYKTDGEIIKGVGETYGTIAFKEEGTNGFGYDPVFVVNGRTMAELSADEKNKISHRGTALGELYNFLKERYGE